MIKAEDLLKPLSTESPCGEDISYDPSFLELDTMLQGKPETQFSAAEEPNWKDVQERCLELWQRSKNLRLATVLTVSALKTEGLGGFHQCLILLNGLVETFWTDLYPRLDPGDGNDPTERVNIIASLAAPIGTFGDNMRVVERLREAPLTNSMRMGRFSSGDILRSQSGTPSGPDNKPPPSAGQIESAFRDTKPEEVETLVKTLTESVTLVGQLDERLTKAVGADKAADLTNLKSEVAALHKHVGTFLPDVAGEALPGGEAQGDGQAAGVAAPKGITGEIQSRGDVVKMIEKICKYYERNEPSSPVPYLLKRAQRLADKNFMDIINDLSPDALAPIRIITGDEPKPTEGQT